MLGCNFFNGEIDGKELSLEQSNWIEIVFNKLRDSENNLNSHGLLDVLGQYPPEYVLKRFFVRHGKSIDKISLCDFMQFIRFLLNGTKEDKLRALFNYYTTSQGYLENDTLKIIIQEEGGSHKAVEFLAHNRNQDEFNDFFLNNPKVTFMSAWLLCHDFNIANRTLKIPSKSLMFSVSFDIPGNKFASLQSSFESFLDWNEIVISKASFSKRLDDIFPPFFIAGLFCFLDCNADGFIDMREFLSRLSVLHHSSGNYFVEIIYQMFMGTGDSGRQQFNANNFVICLKLFVPRRVLQNPSCKIEELKTCTTLSCFSSWTTNNRAFQYFVKFIKTIVHVVFGFPLPNVEASMLETIMLWLHFMISSEVKLGSQWYIFPLNQLPPLKPYENISDLKLSDQKEHHGLFHPISMYEAIRTAVPLSSFSPKSTQLRNYRRARSISCEDDALKAARKTTGRFRRLSRLISNIRVKRRETKAEREASRSLNHHRRRIRNIRSSSGSDLHIRPISCKVSTSREESMENVRTPDEQERDWKIADGPFIAVDRRLAERMQQWSQENGGQVFVSSEGQLLPSYLIDYVPNIQGTTQETLEVQALEICVHAVTGLKLKCAPSEKLIISLDPPRNNSFHEFVHSGAKQISQKGHTTSESERSSPYTGSFRLRYSAPADSIAEQKKRLKSSSSMMNEGIVIDNPDLLEISTQKLMAKPLYFAFSRCHTVGEMFESICKHFTDYCGQDLNSINCRIWLAGGIETSARPKTYSIPKSGINTANSSFNEHINESAGVNIGGCAGKKIVLTPIDLEVVRDQQLACFFADQKISSFYSKQLLNHEARCSHIFDIVIECRVQFLLWALNQRPTKAPQFTGLKNLGNTCYINSVIQCLRATPELTSEIRQCVTPDTQLAGEFITLLDQMQASDEPLNPQPLRHIFVRKWPNFNSHDQQDAQEFLTIFLDSLNEELRQKPQSGVNRVSKSQDNHVILKRPDSDSATQIWNTFCADNDSPVGKIFYGLCESRCTLDGCFHSSSAFDPFSSLTLPLSCTSFEFFTLTVVPHFGAVPEVNRLESDKSIGISFIREEISRRYSCSSRHVFLVRMVGRIFKPIRSKIKFRGSVRKTMESLDGKIWAFILPHHHSEFSHDREFTIIMQNRILVPSPTALLEETALMPEFFGGPTVIQILSNGTNEDLYNIVDKSIRRLVKSSQDPLMHDNCSRTAAYLKGSDEGMEKYTRNCSALRFDKYDTADYIFQIKQSDRHWFKCSKCPWSKMCRGCPIPCNSEKVDLKPSEDTCVYLTVDWNLAAYVNEYQQAQEIKRKIVDPVDEVYLKMKNTIHLEHLLQSYFDIENGNKDECVTCERCEKRRCFTKSTKILVLPDVLLLSLKRFQATKGGWKKLTTLVEFPLTMLDMHPYMSKQMKNEKSLYDLYAVVNHAGTLNEGHYYAHIKSTADNRWFRINDTECYEIPTENVVTSDAYVLFYRRRSS